MKQSKPSPKRWILSYLLLGVIYLAHAPLPASSQTQTPEGQLRERLRTVMLQLRAAESERATLQAAQTQCAEEKKALAARVEDITKQANASKLIAQEVAPLKTQVAEKETEIARLKKTIEDFTRSTQTERAKEVERAKVVEEVVIGLERLVADRQAKNLALYKLSNEILQRYEKFGLGDALTAREPFVGITRVKLENLVQDYKDKIQKERLTLSEQDLAAYRDRLLNPQPQTLKTGAESPVEPKK